MPRWLWFAPFAALVLALAAWGFRLGWIAATLTETDVIEEYASRYIEMHGSGALPTDCSAQPGEGQHIWLVVSCTAPTAKRYDFPVDRLGRLLKLAPETKRPEAPET